MFRLLSWIGFALLAIHSQSTWGQQKPVRVFILAGQSNMEGHAKVSTFDYLNEDPATVPLLEQMRDENGKPRVCEGVWISYLTGSEDSQTVRSGKLTAGYGSIWGIPANELGEKIGPEFTFGLSLDPVYDEPVLIIKTAWGGKSLHTDFRSPSSGPYQLSSFQLENYPKQTGHGIPKNFEEWKREKEKATGHYYRRMMDHVKSVLSDIGQIIPGYEPDRGYVLSGFVWFQGFNDLVDGHVYPNHNQTDRFELYSELLANLIRDIRTDLKCPTLPVVIGVMGVGGEENQSLDMVAFRRAMRAPAEISEFRGNVAAVETAPFWASELGAIDKKHEQINQMRYYLDSKHKDYANAKGDMSQADKEAYIRQFESELISPEEKSLWTRGASNAGYHYLGCAKTFALMGRAFAEANRKMLTR